ncbi:MAG: hypothetical protein ACREAC_25195 [Blastocatellia bacterium]
MPRQLSRMMGLCSMIGLLITCSLSAPGQTATPRRGVLPETRTADAAQLIGILRDQQALANSPDLVISAILTLGEMKPAEAVDDLVPLLTLRRYLASEIVGDTIVGDHFINFSNRFPAVGALTSIGKPALPALARAIGKSRSDSDESRLARRAVMGIFKEDPDAGVRYLRDSAVSALSLRAYRRMSGAAEQAEKEVQAKQP